MKKDKIILFVIGISVILIGGSFYAGTKYGQNKNISASTRENGVSGNFSFGSSSRTSGQRGVRGIGGNNGGAIFGEIISKDNKSITVKLRDSGSKIIFLSDSTSVMKSIDGAISDLLAGEQIMVIGNPNSDGVITAQSIQIRPFTQR